MEPILPSPQATPEKRDSIRFSPEVPKSGQEDTLRPMEKEASRERMTGAGAGDNSPINVTPVISIPAQDTTTRSDTPAISTDSDMPLVAADEDVMEKAWVEKAKKIIASTKHDPYAQENAVSKLQADYLNKRYGKVIKIPNEG